MRAIRSVILFLCAMCLQTMAFAQANRVELEVQFLFSHLKQSGCEFSRNGSWHGAEEAAKHMQRKYDYLKKRQPINTAEQFIQQVATESSMTGKPYLVRCPGLAVTPSAPWFKSALDRFRKPT